MVFELNGEALETFHAVFIVYLLFLFFLTAKKNKKKGKTLTLTDFLAEDSGGNAPPSYAPTKPTSWADETDDLEGDGKIQIWD